VKADEQVTTVETVDINKPLGLLLAPEEPTTPENLDRKKRAHFIRLMGLGWSAYKVGLFMKSDMLFMLLFVIPTLNITYLVDKYPGKCKEGRPPKNLYVMAVLMFI
jgi:hypothetical protein